MKIYFAGSIRGGRTMQIIYSEIVNTLNKHGDVYSGLVAQENLGNEGETELKDNEIFQREISHINNCDVFIAEVSTPSLGVGYEIGLALSLNKKVLVAIQSDQEKNLSAMVAGNSAINKIIYKNTTGLIDKLNETLKK